MASNKIKYVFQGDTSSLRGATNEAMGLLDKFHNAVKGAVSGVMDTFATLSGVQLGDVFSEGAKGAIDYVENLNLFEVAMGNSIEKGQAFVDQMQEVYGMDPSNIYRYSGYFYQLTDAIGMCDEASAAVSLSMTKAANDLSSLFNVDVEKVVNDLSSGMVGMTRTVRKYGMDIRMTTLEQTALKYGIDQNAETMSEADRQALRFITMLEQAQNAFHQTTTSADGTTEQLGDFARNIETPANQLRIFKEQMAQLGRAVGVFIVAPLQEALPIINGFIMAIRICVNFIATLKGIAIQSGESLSEAGDSAEDASDGISSVGKSADAASKKVKKLIAPFDELNVLRKSKSDSDDLIPDDALNPELAKALREMELNLENITMKANKVRDSILEFLGIKVTSDPITGEQIIQWDKEAFKTNVLDSLKQFTTWLNDNRSTIGLFSAAVLGIGAAFGNIPASVALALGVLLKNSESFRGSFTDLFTNVGESVSTWGTTLKGVFSTVGKDITNMWKSHMQPTTKKIGDALAPALKTLGNLWENLSKIIDDIFRQIKNVWTSVLKPAIEGALEIIQDLCDIFKELWEKYVDPVVENIGDGIEDLWTNTLKPIIDKIIGILGKVIELIKALWNNPLKPIVKWIMDVLGPTIKDVFNQVWDIIKRVCEDIGDIIKGVLQVLEGLIDFLVGVFTGDWERALKGLVNILVGIGNTLISVFETIINAFISLINGLLETVWQAVRAAINAVLGAIEGVAEFLGYDINIRLNASVPNIPALKIPRIPEMAKGGVVTGPTHIIAGEGKYSEAILPLDDSPQMNDLINKIVEAIDKEDNSGPQPVEVKVYIGDKEYDAYTYKASERGKKIVGKQPVKIGG